MALAKTRILDKIEIVGDFKIIQARYEIKVTDGDDVIATSFERESYTPDHTIADLPADLQPYANLSWTTDVVNSYTDYVESANPTQ